MLAAGSVKPGDSLWYLVGQLGVLHPIWQLAMVPGDCLQRTMWHSSPGCTPTAHDLQITSRQEEPVHARSVSPSSKTDGSATAPLLHLLCLTVP